MTMFIIILVNILSPNPEIVYIKYMCIERIVVLNFFVQEFTANAGLRASIDCSELMHSCLSVLWNDS